jgi:cytochrome c peroxidase
MKKLIYIFICLSQIQACGDSSSNTPTDISEQVSSPVVSRYDNSSLDPDVIQSFKDLEALMIAASPDGTLAGFKLPGDTEYELFPADPQNPITLEKVELGKLIFHETGITAGISGVENTWSCASCHHAKAGFKAGIAQGIGEGGQGFGQAGEGRTVIPGMEGVADVQPIATPTALNTAYQEVMLWNGQFGNQSNGVINADIDTSILSTEGTPKAANKFGLSGLETQVIAGVGVHRLDVSETSILRTNSSYIELFGLAFPDGYDDLLVAASKAIAAYERSLLANNSPFQMWLQGNNESMGHAEIEGAKVFFGKAGCSDCHTGPALSSPINATKDEMFMSVGFGDLDYNNDIIGSIDDSVRRGRGGFTQDASDDYKFKIPQLYNLKDTSVFGHGASFRSIEDVVEYKIAGVPQVDNPNLDPRFVPIELTQKEKEELILFLDSALNDNALFRYSTEFVPSKLCPLNNDALSQLDLGCEN